MSVRQELDEIDRQEEERMYSRPIKDQGTPYASIGPSEPVRRGATWPGASFFIWLSMERNRRLA